MQAVGIILLLISIGCIVGPIGAVVIMYRDNLEGLVITPQIRDMMSGNSTILPLGGGNNNGNNNNNQNNNNNNNNNNGNNNGNTYTNDNSTNNNNNSNSFGFINPVFVGAQVDAVARTFSVTVNITSDLNYDLTINSLSATVVASQDNYQLGTISLPNPVTLPAGQTTTVTVSGSWTQDAENHINTAYQGQSSVEVNLVNPVVNVNGITVTLPEFDNVASIPIS